VSSLTPNERPEDLPQGARGCVLGYNDTSRPYLRRLLAMGLVPGIEFTVVRRAPFGDPVEIEVLGFHLSLRAHEAAALKVREVRGA
jgi:ferrous iron transport protein A